jgi:hypothetical protein
MKSIGKYQLGMRYDTSKLSPDDKCKMFLHYVLMTEDAYATEREEDPVSKTDKTTRATQRSKKNYYI